MPHEIWIPNAMSFSEDPRSEPPAVQQTADGRGIVAKNHEKEHQMAAQQRNKTVV
jgi:hypothetical protein